MRIRGALSGSSDNVQLSEATPGEGRRRDPDAPPSPASWRGRTLLGVVLLVGIWTLLAAFAGSAGADEGPQAGDPAASSEAPADPAGDAPPADATMTSETTPVTSPETAGPPPAQDASEVSAPGADQTPPPVAGTPPIPAPDPATVDGSTTVAGSVDTSGLESLPALLDGVTVPVLTATDPATDPATAPAAVENPVPAPAAVEDPAPAPAVVDPLVAPDPCASADAAAPLIGDTAVCSDVPQPVDSPRAAPRAATHAADPPPAGEVAAATEEAVTTPDALAPEPPAPPLQPPPTPPMTPPALPAPGSAGGCSGSVSAGGPHDAWSPVAVVDLAAVAAPPSGSNGFGSTLTANVTGRAADPGCRPT